MPTVKPNIELSFYQDIIKYLFDILYMGSDIWNGKTTFFGVPVFQNPFDLWILQEIIVRTKPTLIIETGTAYGGSALYYGMLFDNLALCSKLYGRVITVDIEKNSNIQKHPRVDYLTGSSISESILDIISKNISKSDKVMVVLDSDHSKEYVSRELEAYWGFVSKDCYLVVCDTNLSSLALPIMLKDKLDILPTNLLESLKSVDEYPMSAVLNFLRTNKNFDIDKECEKFHFTFNPNGFLRCINKEIL